MFVIESPTKLRFEGFEDRIEEVRSDLTYTNQQALFEYQRFKKAAWYVDRYGQEAYNDELDRKKAAVKVCLLFEDERGYYTYPGLLGRLERRFRDSSKNLIEYPEPKLVPWDKEPTNVARYYQTAALEKLIEARHAGVEIGTGLGKSFIIELLTKHYGLQTLVMAPSRSIANQLFKAFKTRFGKSKVGMYGDGKKNVGKLFTIGIASSLARIKPGTPEWNFFSRTQVFIADESHLCPASTLESVCHGLVSETPYRFFFSGTQIRNDGAGLLLDAITGPIVYSMTVREGVDQGFLSKPNFFMVKVESHGSYESDDYQSMMQEHFYSSPVVAKAAANFANQAIEQFGHQVLILVEHVDQLQYLLPHFKYECGFAHGGLNKDNRDSVDPRFHKSDPDELVEQFNRGDLKILVGTSCISTGTDIQTAKTIINLQGGTSEIKIRQAIGRGTRKVPGKTSFNYIDFCVRLPTHRDDETGKLEDHAYIRADIYNSVYGPVKWVNL